MNHPMSYPSPETPNNGDQNPYPYAPQAGPAQPQQPYQAQQPYQTQQMGYPLVPLGTTDPANMSLPLYGATFPQAVKRFFAGFVQFTGRASRSEYWWAQLFIGLVYLVPLILISVGAGQLAAQTNPYGEASASASVPGTYIFGMVFLVVAALALFLPNLAITWRRLHDANLPGPWFFISFVPAGNLVLFVMTLMPSKAEGMRFDVVSAQPELPQGPYQG